MSQAIRHLGVVGGGAWGTALALAAVRAGLKVTLWAFETATVEAINKDRRNPDFLPGVMLPPALTATDTLCDLAAAEAILMVCPAQHMGRITADLAGHLKGPTPLVVCSKGIEVKTGRLMSEVLEKAAPGCPVAILSGPTFASEVAKGLPCALTLACNDEDIRTRLIEALAAPEFRLYGSTDSIGAQIGGAVKNVLAIATGMVEGLKLGENARAAVITRGLSEMMRFGMALGARQDTLMGLSGLGDLLLTCSSPQSRNMSLGMALGGGRALEDIMAERKSVAEGMHSVSIISAIAREKGLEMPICFAVDAILHHDAQPEDQMNDLMARPLTDEN